MESYEQIYYILRFQCASFETVKDKVGSLTKFTKEQAEDFMLKAKERGDAHNYMVVKPTKVTFFSTVVHTAHVTD